MPYKSEKIPLGVYDRRIKLNDVQREEIKELRKLGLSYKVIAERYEVSQEPNHFSMQSRYCRA